MLFPPLLLIAAFHFTSDAEELFDKATQARNQGNYGAAERFYRRLLALEDAPDEYAAVAEDYLAPNTMLRVRELQQSGPPSNRVDIFVLAEGFQRDRQEQKTFDTQTELTQRLMMQVPVFKRYARYLNFYGMNIASVDDGVDDPNNDYDTALGASRSNFSQGQVTVDHGLVRQYLTRDERSDGLAVVIVRKGTLGTGGGGVAVVGGGAGNTVVHEFGHAFGMLLDEYTRDVGYSRQRTPRGFNISDTDNPDDVPWKHWLDQRGSGVGIIPGGAGRATGVWRPTGKPCAMASGSMFCVVCREAMLASVYGIVSPIDGASPAARDVVLGDDEERVFTLIPMATASKPYLQVEFSLQRLDADAPPSRPRSTTRDADRDRRNRFRRRPRWGKEPDEPLPGKSLNAKRKRQSDRRIGYEVTLAADDLEPGRYRLHARATDPTDWLIAPEWLPLLTDTRTWDIEIQSGGDIGDQH